jgi:signal transduction histidine kinase
VIGRAAAFGGWLVGVVGVAAALDARRMRGSTLERVARVCHELRGPLTAARLGMQLSARTAELSPERLRAIDLELGMAALALEDLHGVALSRGSPWTGDLVDVGGLLADAVEASLVTAAATGAKRRELIRLTWSGPAAWVRGDRLRLAQATRNLIANALEHGGGGVEIRGAAADGRVRVEVIDRGAGLPASVDKLIRRPRSGRGARGRGLAIAAAVAADHGGRLATAPSERGARLVLELPAARGEATVRPETIGGDRDPTVAQSLARCH